MVLFSVEKYREWLEGEEAKYKKKGFYIPFERGGKDRQLLSVL
jgi:hypothetical protein